MSAPLRIRLKELNEDLAKMLSECYAGRTPLIFPEKRNRERRVSEQESRVLFCQLLNGKGLRYSVEAPTTNKYCFQTGKEEKPRSGNTDMCIYDECDKKIVNIELKSGQPGSKGISISKDLEKLICENVECDSSGEPVKIRKPLILGNWFHTLEHSDSGTLPALWNKFHETSPERDGLPEVYAKIKKNSGLGILPVCILFSFCVLKPHDSSKSDKYPLFSEWFDFDGIGDIGAASKHFFVENSGDTNKPSLIKHHV